MAERTLRLSVCGVTTMLVLATSPEVLANRSPNTALKPIAHSISADIKARGPGPFDNLLSRWEKRYSTRAFEPLLTIARDQKRDDPERYIAMMGAARIGGKASAPFFASFLKDRSWMIRSATLRILAALSTPGAETPALSMLKDKALVVRMEAVNTIRKLRPPGSVDALLSTLRNSENYHRGRAQWVPLRALDALVDLDAKEATPHLRALLDHDLDPDLQRKTVSTLESLTGKPTKPGMPLSERVKHWKLALAKSSG
jgi:HEAT repeat protein